jgi:hypothetical protein
MVLNSHRTSWKLCCSHTHTHSSVDTFCSHQPRTTSLAREHSPATYGTIPGPEVPRHSRTVKRANHPSKPCATACLLVLSSYEHTGASYPSTRPSHSCVPDCDSAQAPHPTCSRPLPPPPPPSRAHHQPATPKVWDPRGGETPRSPGICCITPLPVCTACTCPVHWPAARRPSWCSQEVVRRSPGHLPTHRKAQLQPTGACSFMTTPAHGEVVIGQIPRQSQHQCGSPGGTPLRSQVAGQWQTPLCAPHAFAHARRAKSQNGSAAEASGGWGCKRLCMGWA